MTPPPCTCGPAAAVAAAPPGDPRRCARCGGEVVATPPADPAQGAAVARNLRHEGHVRAIAAMNRLGALVVVLQGGMLLLMVLGALGRPEGPDPVVAAGALLAFVGGLAAFVANHLLARYHDRARWPVVGFTLAPLLLVLLSDGLARALILLFGGAWAGAVAWALTSAEAARICSPPYREAVRRDAAGVPFWRSPLFFLPLGLTVVGCCGGSVLGILGFRSH